MTAPIVGPGILRRMQQYSTTPATPEDYRPSPTNWSYSEAFGKDGRRYVFLKATGAVLVFDWDSSIVAGGGPDPAPPDPPIKQVPSPNFWPTREGHDPIAIVLHTMAGSLAGTDGWFSTPASEVSAHYGVGLSGEIHQYVPLTGSAWANGVAQPGAGYAWPGPAGININLLTVSIETEDLGNANQPVTPAQYTSVAAVGRLTVARYPSIKYLVTHRAITPRDRPNCPGARWTANGGFVGLANELGLTPVL